MTMPSRFNNTRVALGVVLALLLLAVAPTADAQRRERSGKEVVDAVCATCHVPGKDKAPKIGDAKAWSARASQGLSALTEHAIKGIRNMPAHGGNPGVSDIEIERAVVYMVNRSGGRWVEPVGGATPAVLRSSEAIVQNQCAKCHRDGVNGAPKIGDRAAWTPRLRQGLDSLVASAIHGHGAMPARGGLPDLSDQEIRGAIIYMFNYGVPEVAAPPPAPPTDPHHKLIADTDVYLGLISADALRAARGKGNGQAEIPSGSGYYHINISLVDHKSQVPLTNATVKLKVSDGMRTDTKTLDLVAANNAVSYGGFFQLSSGNSYNIIAAIRRPDVSGDLEARFTYKAP
ncbi:MAG TPA: c-type cytochrome [Burkholderiaceae bacterium]|nr:c-type cytochrome [Burkholderiaceae bacterium]